jgi:hypothetical protein
MSFLHGVLFPLFIYGVVFILWVIWVSKFSLYAKILLSHKVRVTIGFIGSIALVVRAFEDELFYDPFLNYFKVILMFITVL